MFSVFDDEKWEEAVMMADNDGDDNGQRAVMFLFPNVVFSCLIAVLLLTFKTAAAAVCGRDSGLVIVVGV